MTRIPDSKLGDILISLDSGKKGPPHARAAQITSGFRWKLEETISGSAGRAFCFGRPVGRLADHLAAADRASDSGRPAADHLGRPAGRLGFVGHLGSGCSSEIPHLLEVGPT